MRSAHAFLLIVLTACGASGSADDDTAEDASDDDSDAGDDDDDASDDDAGDDDDLDDTGVLAADTYCEELVEPFCGFYVRCGRMAVEDAGECAAPFLEACNARYEPRWAALAELDLLELSADGVAACAAHLAAVPCEQQWLEQSGPCAALWRGTQAAGAACGFDVESFVCAPGTTCVLDLSLCGTCEPAAAIGASCADDRCVPEAECVADLCVARALAGESCEDRPCALATTCTAGTCVPRATFVSLGDECDTGHRCPYLSACVGGVCRRTAGLADSCDSDTPCEAGTCESGRCAAPRGPGDPCDAPNDCWSGGCDGGSCATVPSACLR